MAATILLSRRYLPTLLATALFSPALCAADLEREPILYTTAPTHNVITRLQERLDRGEAKLTHDEHFGYLRSLLRELNVPESSQVLVFSKTSLQRQRIGPRTPRALYFDDDVYIGFCQHGDLVEISAPDPQLGTVFYSLDQTDATKPKFARQNDGCLICHASSANQGYPGHLVRSVYPDSEGYPILTAGTHRIDQSSPLNLRWGGWYVSGTSGHQNHLGNLIVRGKQPVDADENRTGVNVADLSDRFKRERYLSPHSDIVALMVLEHQTEMHNLLARAALVTRLALNEEAEINKILRQPPDTRSETTKRRIQTAGDAVLKYMLFSGEATLTEPVRGTSNFTDEFAQRGPRDGRKRSLRDFDLKQRLFAYPCSYLIYSASFDGLPAPMKEYILGRLWDVLTGKDTSADFAHLSPQDRRAILDILRETKPNLPASWSTSR
jgi:hypothetical protein